MKRDLSLDVSSPSTIAIFGKSRSSNRYHELLLKTLKGSTGGIIGGTGRIFPAPPEQLSCTAHSTVEAVPAAPLMIALNSHNRSQHSQIYLTLGDDQDQCSSSPRDSDCCIRRFVEHQPDPGSALLSIFPLRHRTKSLYLAG
jgi:hypothetical protein